LHGILDMVNKEICRPMKKCHITDFYNLNNGAKHNRVISLEIG